MEVKTFEFAALEKGARVIVCGQLRCGMLLAALIVAGCGPKVYLRSVGAEGAKRAKLIVQSDRGAPILLLDDGQDSEPDSILVFDNDELLSCYQKSREDGTKLLVWRAGGKSEDCGAKILALRFPELAEKGADCYVALDKVLGRKRVLKVQGTNVVLRRTTTVGTMKSGQRLEWTRPAGVVRVGAIIEHDIVNPLVLSDWLTVEPGKSYEVRFSRSEAFEEWSLEEDAKASAQARQATASRPTDFM